MSRIRPIIWIQVTKISLLWLTNHAEKTQNHRGAQKSFQWGSNLSDLVQTSVTAARPDQTSSWSHEQLTGNCYWNVGLVFVVAVSSLSHTACLRISGVSTQSWLWQWVFGGPQFFWLLSLLKCPVLTKGRLKTPNKQGAFVYLRTNEKATMVDPKYLMRVLGTATMTVRLWVRHTLYDNTGWLS